MRGIDDFGGLRKPAPVFAGLMGIALFSSLGLPGLNGFVGEFLIFRGVFPLSWVAATVSVLGLLVTAAVILTVIQKVFAGPVPEKWAAFPDLHGGERLAMAPVIGLMLLLGLLPQLIVRQREPDGRVPAGALEILESCWPGRSISRLPVHWCRRCCRRAMPRWRAGLRWRCGCGLGACGCSGLRADGAGRVVIVDVPWVPSMGIRYTLAADGISRVLVLLTGLAAVAGVLFSWNIELRTNEFFAFYLALIGGVYGVFLSFDLFLLFVFYEIAIVPKYFLIAIWGSTRREYGAMKLALYSFVGSAMVLIGLLAAYATAGSHSTGLVELAHANLPVNFADVGCSRWCLSGSEFWRACGRFTPGRRRATWLRRRRPRCCWPAW